MHSLLEHVSIFTVYNLFDTEEKAVKFATEVGLLPHPDDSPKPPCPQCGAECKVTRDKNKKLGFFYTCTKNNTEMCTGTVRPTVGTFFKGSKISIKDALTIIVAFVYKMRVSDLIQHLTNIRKSAGQKTVSPETIVDYYSYLREVAEVYSSHNSKLLGGPGKTIELDETFLNTRKYNRGRTTTAMTYVVFGMYCRTRT
ncbi:hypothetical protein JTE90_003331 [Oedothorax gibbosus]|uniref:Transposase n=1 Tax=Oedothorax gibbosus TaxID=931172 RepID=A0AAV6UGY9_9ARAC|nr:hypothetical protein JTE90_003331 [Oedothorax gibbosus]